MNIIALAYEMAQSVEVFVQKAKRFFYSVMLMGYACPKCKGSLIMAAEGKCRCKTCNYEFNPTIEFQRCPECGGKPVLFIRRYHCQHCMTEIQSRFLFDGLVFNPEYFREKMAESRQCKKEKLHQVKEMLAQSRSQAIAFGAVDLDSVPGLLAALNSLTQGIDENVLLELKGKFDLSRYQSHIKAHIKDFEIDLREIPAIIENARKDLVWRFIAAIFLEHEQEIQIRQQGQTLWVRKYADRERPDFSGEIEEADGLEGLAC